MTDPVSKPSTQPLEGEGSSSATRRYNRHLGEAIAEGDLEAAADAARHAVEGPEGEELLRAAEQAKQGPHVEAPPVSREPKKPSK
jgi:hypothetical protein